MTLGIRIDCVPTDRLGGGWQARAPAMGVIGEGSTIIGALEDLVRQLRDQAAREVDEALESFRERGYVKG